MYKTTFKRTRRQRLGAPNLRVISNQTSPPLAVFYAGRISKGGGYRQNIFGDDRVMSFLQEEYESPDVGRVVYTGPLSISDDHGCYHMGDHGLGLGGQTWCPGSFRDGDMGDVPVYVDEHDQVCLEDIEGGVPLERGDVSTMCFTQIANSDLVHVFIYDLECYGTLVELGFASCIGRPIHAVVCDKMSQKDIDDLWFILSRANVHVVRGGPDTIDVEFYNKVRARRDA